MGRDQAGKGEESNAGLHLPITPRQMVDDVKHTGTCVLDKPKVKLTGFRGDSVGAGGRAVWFAGLVG